MRSPQPYSRVNSAVSRACIAAASDISAISLGDGARLGRSPAPAAPAVCPWRGDQLQRRVVHAMPARQEAEEAAHRGQVPGAGGVAGALACASCASQARKSAGRSAASAARSGSPPRCCVRKPRKPGDVGAVGLHRQRRAPAAHCPSQSRNACRASSPVTGAQRPSAAATARPRKPSAPGPLRRIQRRVARQQRQQRRRAFARHPHQRVVRAPAAPPRHAAGGRRGRGAEHHLSRPSSSRADRAGGSTARAGVLAPRRTVRGVDRQEAGHLVADALRRIGGAHQRQHRFLHPRGQAGGRAAGRQHGVDQLGGMRPLGPQHRRHVVGQRLAVHPHRRRQQAIQLRMLGQPGRVGAQECLDEPLGALAGSRPGRGSGWRLIAASGDLLAGLRPVGQEGGEALVGQRMVEQLAQHGGRQRGDVGAELGCLHHVHRAAHARRPAPRS